VFDTEVIVNILKLKIFVSDDRILNDSKGIKRAFAIKSILA